MKDISESQVVKIWQRQLLDSSTLVTEDGEWLRVIYPGRINDGRGADFRDAVIATRQGLIKGDIEVHVKSSGWWAHHHHQDPVYNRVILHVVMWRDAGVVTNLQNGEKVSILALHKYIGKPVSRWTNLAYPSVNLNVPCREAVERLAPGIIAGFLDSAGEERFLAKVAGFQSDLVQMEASQCLYQGIMGALGYSRNKLPFLELSRRLPLKVLQSIAQGKKPYEECLAREQTLLLGTAGLLPSQRGNWHLENNNEKWVDELEKLWISSRQSEAMSEGDWQLFRIRPNNFPVRRIVAVSHLILRYGERGILEEVISRLGETPASKGCCELKKMLLVATDSYWGSYFDFGSGSRLRAPTLIGDRRAADIVVNVLLPFCFAWGKFTSQPELSVKALDLYSRCPRLMTNAVEKHMRHQLGLYGDVVNSARRQQGLVHIYNTLCSQGRCHRCPLGRVVD